MGILEVDREGYWTDEFYQARARDHRANPNRLYPPLEYSGPNGLPIVYPSPDAQASLDGARLPISSRLAKRNSKDAASPQANVIAAKEKAGHIRLTGGEAPAPSSTKMADAKTTGARHPAANPASAKPASAKPAGAKPAGAKPAGANPASMETTGAKANSVKTAHMESAEAKATKATGVQTATAKTMNATVTEPKPPAPPKAIGKSSPFLKGNAGTSAKRSTASGGKTDAKQADVTRPE
jgi:hypothetical protein